MMKSKMKMSKPFTRLALALSIGLSVFFGSAAAAALVTPYRADSVERLNSSTFHVLLPTRLPAGARLLLTDVRRNPDNSTDVDIFYELLGGGRLHVWETDRTVAALGTKNPLKELGVLHTGSLADWLEVAGMSGRVTTLNGRLGGVLVSIDAPLPVGELLTLADSVR